MKKLTLLLTTFSAFMAAQAFADGKSVYDTACMVCHAKGVTNAPIVGDTAQWAKRSEKDITKLYKNAIYGYQGEVGVMPPKGGFNNLTDNEIRSAVDYMLANSR